MRKCIAKGISSFNLLILLIFNLLNGIASTTTLNSNGLHIDYWQTIKKIPVYFVARTEIPMVDIALIVDAGSARDEKNFGLSYFTSMMVNEGTDKLSATEIANKIDLYGMRMIASVDRDMSIIRFRSMTQKKYLTLSFSLFLDIIKKPSFPQKSFNRVKGQILDAIAENTQDPAAVAINAFYKSIYGVQPYAHPAIGENSTIKNITRDELKKFFAKYYVAKNTKIVIVGNLSKTKAYNFANQIDQVLAAGKKAPPVLQTTQANFGKRILSPMPLHQNTIILGENAISPNDPNYYNLQVANHVLGGLPMTSILFKKVRNEQGLAYQIFSRFVPLAAKGPFVIMMQTRSEKTQASINLILQILQDYIKNGASAEQLSEAKINLIWSFPIMIASNTGILANLAHMAFYNLPLNYLNDYIKNINAVDITAAKEAFAKKISIQHMNTVISGTSQQNQ